MRIRIRFFCWGAEFATRAIRSPIEKVDRVDGIGCGFLPFPLSGSLESDERGSAIGAEAKGDDIFTLRKIRSCLSDQSSLSSIPLFDFNPTTWWENVGIDPDPVVSSGLIISK